MKLNQEIQEDEGKYLNNKVMERGTRYQDLAESNLSNSTKVNSDPNHYYNKSYQQD